MIPEEPAQPGLAVCCWRPVPWAGCSGDLPSRALASGGASAGFLSRHFGGDLMGSIGWLEGRPEPPRPGVPVPRTEDMVWACPQHLGCTRPPEGRCHHQLAGPEAAPELAPWPCFPDGAWRVKDPWPSPGGPQEGQEAVSALKRTRPPGPLRVGTVVRMPAESSHSRDSVFPGCRPRPWAWGRRRAVWERFWSPSESSHFSVVSFLPINLQEDCPSKVALG